MRTSRLVGTSVLVLGLALLASFSGARAQVRLGCTWMLVETCIKYYSPNTGTRCPPSSQASSDCSAQGLLGTCNACICCCYPNTASFVVYNPTSDCTCERQVDAKRVQVTVVIRWVLRGVGKILGRMRETVLRQA